MTKYKCKANNPVTCRYHGSIHIHTQQLTEARNDFINSMREELANRKSTPESKAFVANASAAFDAAQARVDSHDENFAVIEKQIADLEYAADGEDMSYMDEKAQMDYEEAITRRNAALAVRNARENEDNPHGLAYVSESPQTLKEAKEFLKDSECGEFVGINAGQGFKGQTGLKVIGSEGYYEIAQDGTVYAMGSLHDLKNPRTPAVVKSNPAITGANLRWKQDNRVDRSSGRVTTEAAGYIVYTDTDEYAVDISGVVRVKTGLLSLK